MQMKIEDSIIPHYLWNTGSRVLVDTKIFQRFLHSLHNMAQYLHIIYY